MKYLESLKSEILDKKRDQWTAAKNDKEKDLEGMNVSEICIFGEESTRSFHKAIVPRVSFLAQKFSKTTLLQH